MTTYDGQDKVDITIYQGEDSDALNNIKIGEFSIQGLRNVPAGNVILLTLDLDLNGILHVSAVEKETGIEKTIVINNALSRIDINKLESAQQRITSLFGHLERDPKRFSQENFKDQNVLIIENKALDLISRSEGLYDKVSQEDKEDLINLVAEVKYSTSCGDIDSLDNAISKLEDMLHYLEN